MWEDTEIARDIWNERWKRQDIEDVFGRHAKMIVSPDDFYLLPRQPVAKGTYSTTTRSTPDTLLLVDR